MFHLFLSVQHVKKMHGSWKEVSLSRVEVEQASGNVVVLIINKHVATRMKHNDSVNGIEWREITLVLLEWPLSFSGVWASRTRECVRSVQVHHVSAKSLAAACLVTEATKGIP